MAPVFINGSGPYKFVIDTGASRSVVAPHVAVALGLHTSQDKLLELRGVTGSEVGAVLCSSTSSEPVSCHCRGRPCPS
jgi:predicted aspartyl protease